MSHLLVERAALRLARRLYRMTPYKMIRGLLFRSFLHAVRGHRVQRTVEGMTFDLDLAEMIDVEIYLQQYERDIVGLIEGLVRPGWSVLDIGANIGAHTLRFAKLAGPTGRVYAFEPMEYAHAKLVRNLSLNRMANTQAFRIALSDRSVARQPVSFRSSWSSNGIRRMERNVVDFRTLDDWSVEHGVSHVQLIKLDVDGHEFQVLKGGLGMIERCRPILLIETGAWHNSAETDPLRLLATRGYRFWHEASLTETDVAEVRAGLPARDDEMRFSLNLVASVAPLSLISAGHES